MNRVEEDIRVLQKLILVEKDSTKKAKLQQALYNRLKQAEGEEDGI